MSMNNNAPEKIYLIRNISTLTSLNTTNDCHEKYLQEWYKEREKESDIEYTRTDAFIEKAAKWINEHTSLSEKLVIENFVNYMKGE